MKLSVAAGVACMLISFFLLLQMIIIWLLIFRNPAANPEFPIEAVMIAAGEAILAAAAFWLRFHLRIKVAIADD
jgi:hypothetical protein